MYFEKDKERGADATFLWFIEEVGELAVWTDGFWRKACRASAGFVKQQPGEGVIHRRFPCRVSAKNEGVFPVKIEAQGLDPLKILQRQRLNPQCLRSLHIVLRWFLKAA